MALALSLDWQWLDGQPQDVSVKLVEDGDRPHADKSVMAGRLNYRKKRDVASKVGEPGRLRGLRGNITVKRHSPVSRKSGFSARTAARR